MPKILPALACCFIMYSAAAQDSSRHRLHVALGAFNPLSSSKVESAPKHYRIHVGDFLSFGYSYRFCSSPFSAGLNVETYHIKTSLNVTEFLKDQGVNDMTQTMDIKYDQRINGVMPFIQYEPRLFRDIYLRLRYGMSFTTQAATRIREDFGAEGSATPAQITYVPVVSSGFLLRASLFELGLMKRLKDRHALSLNASYFRAKEGIFTREPEKRKLFMPVGTFIQYNGKDYGQGNELSLHAMIVNVGYTYFLR